MKKIGLIGVFLLLAALLFVCAGCEGAESEIETTEGRFTFLSNGDGTCTLTEFHGGKDLVQIPETSGEGEILTKIGNGAFATCSAMTSVQIPETVTEIGAHAFERCVKLSAVELPAGLQSIGSGAFEKCVRLETVVLPDGIEQIPNHLFNGCTRLRGVTLPDGLRSIGEKAFYECLALETLAIPDGVTQIGNKAFYKCKSLSSMTFPTAALGEEGEDDAVFGFFFGSVSNPAMGSPVPKSLQSLILTGSAPIGESAFAGAPGLKSVTISNGTEVIGAYAFKGCSQLTDVFFPTGLREIAQFAFADCTALTEAIIPKSVQKIGLGAFSGCKSITTVEVPFLGASSDPNERNNHFGYIFGAVSADYNHSALSAVSELTLKLTGGSEIASGAFLRCTKLTQIILPATLTIIRAGAFEGCTALGSVLLPEPAEWTIDGAAVSDADQPEAVAAMLTDTHLTDEWVRVAEEN